VVNDQMYSNGPAKVDIATSLERIPVFVRAGTILPIEENGKIVLHIYPLSASESTFAARGTLYNDAGDGYGQHRVDHLHLDRGENGFELVRISEGDYPVPENGFTIQLHGIQATQAWVDGNVIDINDNRVDVGSFQQVKITLA
jgi:alpha-glucosidase